MTTIQGLDALQRKLKTLQQFSRWAYKPMEQSVALVQHDITTVEPVAEGAFSQLATPRQKRAYWAKVRSGEAKERPGGGYRRTNTIVRAWTSEVKNSVNGVQGIVGNVQPAAKYVHSAAAQQPFHKVTGWHTDEDAINNTSDRINRVWQIAVRRKLED